jgi:hypothetical protein
VVGYECDGCVFTYRDGLPVPTGEDGTPPSFEILGTCPTQHFTRETAPRPPGPGEPSELEYIASRVFGTRDPEAIERILGEHRAVARITGDEERCVCQQLYIARRIGFDISHQSSGGGSYASLFGRRVSSGNDYHLLLRYNPGGEVIAYLRRSAGGSTTVLGWTRLPGSVSPGDVLRTRLQVSGTDTTQARAKVWQHGQAEPQDWLLSGSETTPAALRSPGHVGVLQYVSGSWTGAVPVLSIDNYRASAPGAD